MNVPFKPIFYLLFTLVLFVQFASAAPVISSIVIGDDKPVQEFMPSSFIPLTATVQSNDPKLFVSYCICSMDIEGGCGEVEVSGGSCGVMQQMKKEGSVSTFFMALVPPVTAAGTYKVRVNAFERSGNGVARRYLYAHDVNSKTRGVITVSNALTFSSTSTKKTIHTPEHVTVNYDTSNLEDLRALPSSALSSTTGRGSCFLVKDVKGVTPIVGTNYRENQLQIFYNPLCQVCGTFKLPIQRIGSGIQQEEIAVKVPCTADVLIVANGKKFREPYKVTLKKKVNVAWKEVLQPPIQESREDYAAYYTALKQYVDKLAQRKISVRYVELDDGFTDTRGSYLGQFSGQVTDAQCLEDYIDLPPRAVKQGRRFGLLYPQCATAHIAFVDKVKALREKVKPNFLILAGHHRLLPSGLLSCTDGDYTGCIFSDDTYASPVRSKTPLMYSGLPEIPVSRVPGFNAVQLTAMFTTMSRTSAVSDTPDLLMLPVNRQSGHSEATVEKHESLYYKGVLISRNLFGQNCEAPNCYLAPSICLPWAGSNPQKQDCDASSARRLFSTSGILVFQGHSFRQGWLGDHTWPEKEECINLTGKEHGCDYFSIVSARDPRDSKNQPTLPSRTPTFFINHACNSANTVGERRGGDDDTPGNQPLIASAMLIRSTVAGIGFTGKSHSIIMIPDDVFNDGISAGNLWMRIKRKMARKDPEQMPKIALVGDPTLVVTMKKA